MTMKWQFATIFIAIYAVLPVGAVESVKSLTPEDVARLNAQLQVNNHARSDTNAATGRSATNASGMSDAERISAERLKRMGSGPMDLLKMTAQQSNSAATAESRKPRELQVVGMRTTIEKPSKLGGKTPKRQKTPKRSQAKSR